MIFNTCFLEPTRVHNPNGISIGSAVFPQLTAEFRIVPPHGSVWTPPSNTCLIRPTRVHNQNGISIDSAVFAFCAPHIKVSSAMSGHDLPSPSELPLPIAIWTHLMWFLGFNRLSIPNGISIGSVVLHRSRQTVPILYNGRPFPCRLQLNYHGISGPRLIHDALGPSKPKTQMASRSVQPFLQGSLL